jgi:hypothetical protein
MGDETMNAKELDATKLERRFCAAHCSGDKAGEREALKAIEAAQVQTDRDKRARSPKGDLNV